MNEQEVRNQMKKLLVKVAKNGELEDGRAAHALEDFMSTGLMILEKFIAQDFNWLWALEKRDAFSTEEVEFINLAQSFIRESTDKQIKSLSNLSIELFKNEIIHVINDYTEQEKPLPLLVIDAYLRYTKYGVI